MRWKHCPKSFLSDMTIFYEQIYLKMLRCFYITMASCLIKLNLFLGIYATKSSKKSEDCNWSALKCLSKQNIFFKLEKTTFPANHHSAPSVHCGSVSWVMGHFHPHYDLQRRKCIWQKDFATCQKEVFIIEYVNES